MRSHIEDAQRELADMVADTHPRLGINARTSVCRYCNVDCKPLLLLGSRNWVIECGVCKRATFGQEYSNCRNPLCKSDQVKRRELEDGEKLPGSICQSCEIRMKEAEATVAAGGVYFRCTKCGTEGTIKADTNIARELRKTNPAPAPVGVELEGCPNCTKAKEVEPCPDDGNPQRTVHPGLRETPERTSERTDQQA